jgi:cytochrome b
MIAQTPAQSRIRIWDLPTRIFHVVFACSVVGAIISAKVGQAWIEWHVRFGIATLALLIFRIVWGLIGPRYARFSQFVCGPVTVWRYITQTSPDSNKIPGHNPLGALSIIAMLAIIGVQAVTGLFANDDILTQGPFAQYVSDTISAFMTGIHQLNEKFVFAIIGLHLIAILIYTLKGQKLIAPMVHGDVGAENFVTPVLPARDDPLIRIVALVLILLLAWAAWWLIQLGANAGTSFN